MNGWFASGVFVLLGLFAGANLTFQTVVNAELRAILGSPLRASLVSYLGGTLCCIAFLLIRRESLAIIDGRAFASNPVFWTGGLYGLIYLAIAIWLVPRVPLGALFAIVVAGQVVAALVFEHVGLFGTPVRPIDPAKMCGVVLLALAVYLIRR